MNESMASIGMPRRSPVDRQVLILQEIIENKDTGKMRNTLTNLFSKLKDKIPRSSLHRSLKTLVDKGLLVEESDEIESINNQPMKIIRYVISPVRVSEASRIIQEHRERVATRNPVASQ